MARKSNAGRKSAYDKRIKPRLGELEEWLKAGMLEKDCIRLLGISKDTWYRYKRESKELSDLIDQARVTALQDLENEADLTAKGRTVTNTKRIYKIDKEGNRHLVKIEEQDVFIAGNVQMQKFLLANWNPDKYSKDPIGDRIRKEELELKKKRAEEEDW